MATLVSYGIIDLELIKTNVFSRQAVYDESGRTYLYTKFTYDCTCYFNPEAMSYGNGGNLVLAGPGNFPAVTDVAIRALLLTPQQLLTIYVDQDLLLHSPLPGFAVDAIDGPKPISCDVRQILGSKTFIVNWRVETNLTECESEPDVPLISNNWSQSQSTDMDQITTQTTRGVAVFRSDLLAENVRKNADAFRNICLPPVPSGFRRIAINVQVNPVGNILTYEVVDREQFYSLGDNANLLRKGVLEFQATQTQATVPMGESGLPAPWVMATLDVRARGNKDSTRAGLIGFAAKMAIERLQLRAGPINAATDGMLRQIAISENLHERSIQLHAQVQMAPAHNGGQGLGGLRLELLGADVIAMLANDGNNPQLPNDDNSRGTYAGHLFVSALQTACRDIKPTKATTASPNPGVPPTLAGPTADVTVTVSVVDDLTTVISKLSTETTDNGVFTEYAVNVTYEGDEGVILGPVAGPRGSRAEIMQLEAPWSTKTVAWKASRVGRRPLLPYPYVNDPNLTLKSRKVTDYSPVLGPDLQTLVYSTGGVYVYLMADPLSAGDTLDGSLVPWMAGSFRDNAIPASDFVHGIIDSGSGSGSVRIGPQT